MYYEGTIPEEHQDVWENPDDNALLAVSPKIEGSTELAPMPQQITFEGQGALANQNKLNAMQDVQEQLGIQSVNLGDTQGNNMSGIAINSLASSGELSTANYTDNTVRTLKHAMKVLIEYATAVMDYPIQVLVGDKTMTVVPSEVLKGRVPRIDAESGPVQASQRSETKGNLQKIATSLGPDRGAMVMPYILEMEDSTLMEPLIKKLKAEFGLDEATMEEDPAAIQALEQADQVIEQWKATAERNESIIEQQNEVISAARQQLISNADELKNKLQLKMIDSVTKLKQEAMQQEGDNQRMAIKMAEEAERELQSSLDVQFDAINESMRNSQALMSQSPVRGSNGIVNMSGVGVPILSRQEFHRP